MDCRSRPSVWLFCGRCPTDRTVTADDIDKVIRAEIGAISRQAVYDALAAITDRGLLRRIQPAGSPARGSVRHELGGTVWIQSN